MVTAWPGKAKRPMEVVPELPGKVTLTFSGVALPTTLLASAGKRLPKSGWPAAAALKLETIASET